MSSAKSVWIILSTVSCWNAATCAPAPAVVNWWTNVQSVGERTFDRFSSRNEKTPNIDPPIFYCYDFIISYCRQYVVRVVKIFKAWDKVAACQLYPDLSSVTTNLRLICPPDHIFTNIYKQLIWEHSAFFVGRELSSTLACYHYKGISHLEIFIGRNIQSGRFAWKNTAVQCLLSPQLQLSHSELQNELS